MMEHEKKRFMKEDAITELDKSKKLKQIREQNERMLFDQESKGPKNLGDNHEFQREKQRLAQEQQKRFMENYN